MSVNLSVILTDDEVCLRTEAGCEICSMQRVDTDEKRTSCSRENSSRLVGCGNLETTEGFLTDPPAGDVDSHNIVCSWCAQAHVFTHSCDSTS